MLLDLRANDECLSRWAASRSGHVGGMRGRGAALVFVPQAATGGRLAIVGTAELLPCCLEDTWPRPYISAQSSDPGQLPMAVETITARSQHSITDPWALQIDPLMHNVLATDQVTLA